MKTNRDLYLAIVQLLREQPRRGRDLETFLIALHELAGAHASESRMPLATFFGLLQRAFSKPAGGFDEAWRSRYGREPGHGAYAIWEQTIIEQIVDLNEMRAAGTLDDPHMSLGATAPHGSHWYNTSPHGFLECAAEGSFGGWEPDDGTGRTFVPGEVAYLKPDGSFGSAVPEAFARPVVEISAIDWAAACDFLWHGQHYE